MPRGSKPGEHRGGRKKGTPNKANVDLRAMCQQYTAEAVAVLANAMRSGQSPRAEIGAKELLDRGHGRPPQALAGPDGTGPVQVQVVTGIPRPPGAT